MDGPFYAGNWEVMNDNLVGDMPGPESHLATCGRALRPATLEERRIREADGRGGQPKPTSTRLQADGQAEKILLDFYLLTPLNVTTSRHLVKP